MRPVPSPSYRKLSWYLGDELSQRVPNSPSGVAARDALSGRIRVLPLGLGFNHLYYYC